MNAVKPKATIPGSVAQSSMRLVAAEALAGRAGRLAREAEAGWQPGHRAADAVVRRSTIASAKPAVPVDPPRS